MTHYTSSFEAVWKRVNAGIGQIGSSGETKSQWNQESTSCMAGLLGDSTLKTIARELVDTVRRNTTIDWTVRENVRAHLRVLVKRILRKYGYPPDKQEKATLTVLEQAEALSANCPSF